MRCGEASSGAGPGSYEREEASSWPSPLPIIVVIIAIIIGNKALLPDISAVDLFVNRDMGTCPSFAEPDNLGLARRGMRVKIKRAKLKWI